MKKLVISFCLCFVINLAFAQNTMVLHLNNGTKYIIPLQVIDSIRFQTVPSPTKQTIYQNNGNILTTSLSIIDSITYTIPSTGGLPVVSTSTPNVLSATSAFGGGVVLNDGGYKVFQRGICWSTSSNPTIFHNLTIDTNGLGSFGSDIYPLTTNTNYFIRAYAINKNGTSYGSQLTFKTSIAASGSIPTVTTDNIKYQDSLSIISNGSISNDGGLVVTARGVCMAVGITPTINHIRTVDGSGVGTFTSRVVGLLPNTKYFIRAYATNDAGTAYGNTFSFITKDIASITTDSVFKIKPRSATFGIFVKSDGGAAITSRGVCWNYSKLPTIKNYVKYSGIGTGKAFPEITGLVNDTIYYARAFAVNAAGTSYGKEIAFRTKDGKIIIKIDSVFGILSTSALVANNVISDGGDSIKVRGICWSTKSNPTLNDNKALDGKSYGSRFQFLLNLKKDTTYYACAFAQNNIGTYYSNVIKFTASFKSGFKSKKGVGANLDNYQYKTIVTGNGQEWFAENLRTTKFSNGDNIPNITLQWQSLVTPGWSNYNNDTAKGKIYGKLYNFYTVKDTRNMCPYGWHVPKDDDWNELEAFLGDSAGSKLKSKGTAYWSGPNTSASDLIGFSALPSGCREGQSGVFSNLGAYSQFWTPSQNQRMVVNFADWIGNGGSTVNVKEGMAVRCIRD